MRANYTMQRLYAEHIPACGEILELCGKQAHYLLHVLRLRQGQDILLFDGKSGEWRARLSAAGKKTLHFTIEAQTRGQPQARPPLIYCFAPLKQARLDYLAQKATEMGASHIQPVLTRHTQISRVNGARLRANSVEAAEQCGILALPACAEPLPLPALLAGWQQQWGQNAQLIFCDEGQADTAAEAAAESAAGTAAEAAAENELGAGPAQNPLPRLLKLQQQRKAAASAGKAGAMPALGLLIGPEGGFSEEERALLNSLPFVCAIPLGPRIMRADTAAVAALALVQAVLGDW